MRGLNTEIKSEDGYNTAQNLNVRTRGNQQMTNRHEYIEKFKTKLDEWDIEIDELEAKALKARSEIKYEVEDQLTSLRLKRDLARLKMAEVKDASEEAWVDIKEGADEAWGSLKEAIEKAWSHYK